MEAVAQSHAFIDSYMEHAGRISAELGKPVRCRGAGCFACCKEPVHAERTEVQHLLEPLTTEERVEVQERTGDWLARFRSHGGFELPKPRDNPKGDYKMLMRYRAAALWCPLLKDGACMVYDRRPASCRYHSVIGHPRKCEDDAQRPRQVFLNTTNAADVNLHALGLLCQNAPTALFEFDHLGVWLAHELLGETQRTASAENCMITQTDPN